MSQQNDLAAVTDSIGTIKNVHSQSAGATVTFTRSSLGRVRTLVRVAAASAGIAPQDLDDLMIVVAEIITDAVRPIGGEGTIVLRHLPGGLLAEIRHQQSQSLKSQSIDNITPVLPDGRDLRMAHPLARDITITRTVHGTSIRIFTPSAPTA